MKGTYNIKNDEFFQVLKTLDEELYRINSKYFIFGGMGVQAQIAKLETNNGKEDIKNIDKEKFRKTGDIDIYISNNNPILFFNRLAAMYSEKNIINRPNAVKFGKININYVTNPSRLKGFEKIALDQLAERERIKLKKGNNEIKIDVSPIEYLIAAKLSGNKIQAKDEYDINQLIKTTEKVNSSINYDKIENLLKKINKKERYSLLHQITE